MKPTAMRCTEDEFQKIKVKLNNKNLFNISEFINFPFLVNDHSGISVQITNLSSPGERNRIFYDKWDEEIFLANCDIIESSDFYKSIPDSIMSKIVEYTYKISSLGNSDPHIIKAKSFLYIFEWGNTPEKVNFWDFYVKNPGQFPIWNGIENRFVHQKWNEKKSIMKPTAMRCNSEQFEKIQPKLIECGMSAYSVTSFKLYPYLVNNYLQEFGKISNIHESRIDDNRTVYEEWDEILFLHNCGILTKPKPMRNLTVNFNDILEIHRIACSLWKSKLAKIYFPRISEDQTITFSEEEIQEMFESATAAQDPVLVRIFGPRKIIIPLDYNKLKLGSSVLINSNSSALWGSLNGDPNKPYHILLYNEPYIFNNLNCLVKVKGLSRATSLIQNNIVCHFLHKEEPDYIKEVLEY